MNKSGTRAVVIGGGIGGSLAARVLTEKFEQVFVVERDRYHPDGPFHRAGVPQDRHVHNMLLRGQHILEELFPSITAKLMAQGAIRGNLLHDVVARYSSGWLPHPNVPPSVLDGYFCSRLLLEWEVRQEVAKYDQVRFLEGQEVIGLVTSADKRSVTGVQVRARSTTHPDSREVTELPADLVVDASGRDSQASVWLEAHGYPPTKETVVTSHLGYATRVYTANPQRDFRGLIIASAPPKQLRSGVIWSGEGGRWWVVLAGSAEDYPPTDEEGFLAFAKTLADRRLYEEIRAAQPESKIYGYRRTENRLRHFDFVDLPEHFVVIGDAVCALNPVYGQGMTTAAEGAILLRDLLRAQKRPDLQGFSRRFHQAQARLLRGAWQLASASDYRVPGVEAREADGNTGRASRIVRGYLDEIVYMLPTSPVVCLRFLEVINMLKPGTALFHPAIVSRVVTHRLRRHFLR